VNPTTFPLFEAEAQDDEGRPRPTGVFFRTCPDAVRYSRPKTWNNVGSAIQHLAVEIYGRTYTLTPATVVPASGLTPVTYEGTPTVEPKTGSYRFALDLTPGFRLKTTSGYGAFACLLEDHGELRIAVVLTGETVARTFKVEEVQIPKETP
jgi:hypothetical protein